MNFMNFLHVWCNSGRVKFVEKMELLKAATQQAASLLGSYSHVGDELNERQLKALRKLFLIMDAYVPEDVLRPPRKASEKNSIIYALNPETSKWASLGITDELMQAEWEICGFTSESAEPWIREGIEAAVARSWNRSHAKDAKIYIDMGWTPYEARSWEAFNAAEANQWKQAKVSPSSALEWKQANVTVADADLVAKMNEWRTVKPTTLRKRWGDMNIRDVYNFVVKGYTPAVAKKLLAKGKSSATVPHVRGEYAVAGKTFKHFIVQAEASPFTWKFPVTKDDLPIEEKDIVTVEFVAQHEGAEIRTLTMRFTQSGRFIGAEDSRRWSQTRRSINEVDAVLLDPS